MAIQTVTTGFNIQADGRIVLSGDHAPGTSNSRPFADLGITCLRLDAGSYRISGPSVAWPDGWKASVYRDENDAPTVRIALGTDGTLLTIACTDPETGTPKDIVYLLTVRVAVTVDVPEPALEPIYAMDPPEQTQDA